MKSLRKKASDAMSDIKWYLERGLDWFEEKIATPLLTIFLLITALLAIGKVVVWAWT